MLSYYTELWDNKLSWYSPNSTLAHLAGAAEYTDCISAEGQDSSNECSGYDAKQSDSEALVILELWGMWNTPSLLSLPGPL